MDRRYFCKIASLAAGAIGLNAIPASALIPAAPSGSGQPSVAGPSAKTHGVNRIATPCRVTVLRRECHLDLQALYLDDPDAGPCRLFKSGDEYTFAAGSVCPADFCPRLWELICAAAVTDPCDPPLDHSTTLLACPDGTRPVIIRVDRL